MVGGITKNLNVRVLKNQWLKCCVGGNNFPLSNYRTTMERLLRDYQATFPLRRGNFILTATVLSANMSEKNLTFLTLWVSGL